MSPPEGYLRVARYLRRLRAVVAVPDADVAANQVLTVSPFFELPDHTPLTGLSLERVQCLSDDGIDPVQPAMNIHLFSRRLVAAEIPSALAALALPATLRDAYMGSIALPAATDVGEFKHSQWIPAQAAPWPLALAPVDGGIGALIQPTAAWGVNAGTTGNIDLILHVNGT